MTTPQRRNKSKLPPIPVEHRAALKAMAEEVAEKVAKRVLYRSQDSQRKLIRDALVEAGLVHADPDDQKEKIADEIFVRDLRMAAKGRPAKIGFAILSTGLGVVGALITYALQSFFTPFIKFFIKD
jgi:hypothetical protein